MKRWALLGCCWGLWPRRWWPWQHSCCFDCAPGTHSRSTDKAPAVAQHAQVDIARAHKRRLATVVHDKAAQIKIANAGQRRAQADGGRVFAHAAQAVNEHAGIDVGL